MPRDFLLEIGLEEIPARFIPDASAQLKDKVEQFLKSKRIGFAEIKPFSTPRRLAVWVKQVEERQEDLNEILRGPAKRIAVEEDGSWSKAAIGFARGKGANVEDLFIEEVKGEEYLFVRKSQAGEPTVQILPELVTVISSMSFPKNMRWGKEELRFVRPIRWIVALFGDEVIPMTIAGVRSGAITYGHRFLGNQVTLASPDQYVSLLEKGYCLVDPDERRNRIVEQIRALEAEKGWVVPLDEGLLEEVTNLVEYPTVLYGSFDETFLQIPSQVLITSMREHQRYFPVESPEGELLPYFITVRNGDRRNLEGVAKGNEKVLSARLADARFFYEEDQKMSIDACLARLESVIFHEELGTIADKVRRIRELSGEWTEMLKLDQDLAEAIDRTASICKFDLVTHMVYEFPELQGIMGADYARKLGESEEVSQGIFEHYLPRFAGDQLPASTVGAIVGLADKIDTIVGSFSIGIIPTGSQDPYGLRRAAQGIVQILLDKELPLTLDQLWRSSIQVYRKRNLYKENEEELLRDLDQFFMLRLKNLLQERGIRYDVIDAVLSAPIHEIVQLVKKADILQERVERPDFKKTVEAFTRVNNLANKAEHDHLQPSDLVEEIEQTLWEAYQTVNQTVENALSEGDLSAVLDSMTSLQTHIEAFFANVMVMVEDEKLRTARLALLKRLSRLFAQYADFNKLVFSS